MVFKCVVLCVAACLVQQSIAGPYYQPKPPCGCSTGKGKIEEIERISYKTSSPAFGCGSSKVSIGKIEEIEKINYKPSSSPRSYGSGHSSGCVSIEIPTSGGALAVTSIGPITPTGIAVASDVSLGGDLALSGVLPYLSAVAFEGQFAANGAAPVAYGCGDCVAITEQIGGNSGSYGPSQPLPSQHGHYGCGCKY